MAVIKLIPVEEFARVRAADIDLYDKLTLLATMNRANALATVKRAGSGHLGSSFSAMDIAVWLYEKQMNTMQVGHESTDRDVYFSSKGHDVPGLYSLFYSLGILPEERLMKLRRLGGLDGHPDVKIPGIEANSGSLGMGISKGRGIAWAKEKLGNGGHVYVMTGDGELQEGQNYEALHAAVHQGIGGLTVIVDNNTLQSDMAVCDIMALGDLEGQLRAFGWHVARCDGHDFRALEKVFQEFAGIKDKPKILIADTIKGRGVSFMEHPEAVESGGGYYKWHSGAPNDDDFARGHAELLDSVKTQCEKLGIEVPTTKEIAPEAKPQAVVSTQEANQMHGNALGEPVSSGAEAVTDTAGDDAKKAKPAEKVRAVSDEYVAVTYGETLVDLAEKYPNFVVLDGDLAADCKVRAFELKYPDRFIQNGIAEQDMVSMAGGLARHGLLPIVNSFASFLSSRANEQIYNNATERSKIIYANHYAGLIPAGPGKSHQSIRDISLLGALPNMIIVQPSNAVETRAAVEWAISEAEENVTLRFIIGPSPRVLSLPDDYQFSFGQGAVLHEGDDAVVFSYGPVMLHEAMKAAEQLKENGFGLRVVNMPWLNRVDEKWALDAAKNAKAIWVLEDHSPVGGLGDRLREVFVKNDALAERDFTVIGVEGYPACGTPPEALEAHKMSGARLAERIGNAQ